MSETIYHPGFKNLPTFLVRNGLTLRQIKRTEKAGMYSVGGRGFEVFKIRTHKAWQVKAKDGSMTTVEAAQSYPSNEDFGVSAWYYMPDQAAVAERKFQEISDA